MNFPRVIILQKKCFKHVHRLSCIIKLDTLVKFWKLFKIHISIFFYNKSSFFALTKHEQNRPYLL